MTARRAAGGAARAERGSRAPAGEGEGVRGGEAPRIWLGLRERFRQRENEDTVPAAPAPLASARAHRHELLAVDHVHGRRGEHTRASIELPQHFAGPGVECIEVAGGFAACADKNEIAGGDDRPGLSVAVILLTPL